MSKEKRLAACVAPILDQLDEAAELIAIGLASEQAGGANPFHVLRQVKKRLVLARHRLVAVARIPRPNVTGKFGKSDVAGEGVSS